MSPSRHACRQSVRPQTIWTAVTPHPYSIHPLACEPGAGLNGAYTSRHNPNSNLVYDKSDGHPPVSQGPCSQQTAPSPPDALILHTSNSILSIGKTRIASSNSTLNSPPQPLICGKQCRRSEPDSVLNHVAIA